MRNKALALMLALVMVLALLPTAAFAEDSVDFSGEFTLTVGNYTLEEGSTFKRVTAPGDGTKTGLYYLLPTTGSGAKEYIDISGIAGENHPVVIKHPKNVQDHANSVVYKCVGVVIKDQPAESNIKNFNQSDSLTLNLTDENIRISGNKQYVSISFIWQKADTYTVTYDFSGPEGTSTYPVIAKYEVNDRRGPWEPPYSLGYFTVPQSEDRLNLIYNESDEPLNCLYSLFLGKFSLDKNVEAKKLTLSEGSKLAVMVAQGDSASVPRLAQHRNLSMENNLASMPEVFYPIVSWVAVGSGGTRYELSGWKVNGEGEAVAAGLYGDEYIPSGNTTLKADWKEITLTETDPSDIPEVSILGVYDDVDAPVKPSQKTTGYFVVAPVATDTTGAISYRAEMKLSDLFSGLDMPWRTGSRYYKSVDNGEFASVQVTVKLDEHLVPADEEGVTSIKIENAFLEFDEAKGVEVDGEKVSVETENNVIKATLNGAKVFTINFKWLKPSISSSGLNIEIPAKVEDGFAGEITGTTVTVTGSMDFTKAHKEENANTGTAEFSAEEFVRYLLATDETWFNKYGGEDMTLTDMLQAAKDAQTKLSKLDAMTSNALIATASEKIDSLTLDKTDDVTLNVNETATLTPSFTPNSVTNKAVTWSVDEAGKDVVKVENGVITGLKPGEATVTCTSVYDTTKTAQVKVTVNGIVYVESAVGGTVTITGDNVAPIPGTDNAYSVKKSAEVSVTVTPDDGNTMAGEPSAYYIKTTVKSPQGAGPGKVEITNEDLKLQGSKGTYTFTLPEDASTVYISAAFVIESTDGKTVIDDPKTVTDGNNKGYTFADKVNVKVDSEAVSEVLDLVTEDSSEQFSETALKKALTEESVSEQDTVYRHIQTQAKISVDSVSQGSAVGTRNIQLNIDFQYRVVASTEADPEKLNFDSDKNAAVIKPTGSDENGWVTLDSKAPAYIVVPMPTWMGKPGEWVRVTHTHNDVPLEPQYLQIQGDSTVTYVNNEGFSPFLFEQLAGVMNIRLEHNGELVGVENFTPATTTYNISVGSDVERLTFVPEGNVSGFVVTLNGEEVPNTGIIGKNSYELNLASNSVNKVEISYNHGQPYIINITRGTPYNPAPTPSTYTVKTNEVENATVETSATTATAGTDITVTVTPAENYHVSALTVTASNGAAVAVTDNKDGTYTFKMPASNVTVAAEVYECPSMAFPDIDLTQWYHEYTDYAIAHGLMEGTGADFEPETLVTRAQMAVILWNLSNNPKVEAEIPFTDVPANEWYTEAIRWAASVEVVSGCGDGTFKPDENINREQMAAMLYNYEQKLGTGGFAEDETFDLTFDDAAEISTWAQEAVAWCTMKGVIKGSDNKFTPANTAKRSDLATILSLYDQLAK